MKFFSFLFFLFVASVTIAQSDTSIEVEKKKYQTVSIEGLEKPNIDGIIDDAAWNQVEWAKGFTVSSPNNGDAPTRETEFKILYDLENLYVAYRCHDENPDDIVKRLARRDRFPGDWVEINIDSYFDKNTAFSFTSSVSGVKGDEFVTGNGNNWDTNWNPIWYLETNIDDKGWTAEVRIPLSQLRYGNKEEQVWGFNVMRRDFRADERSTWQWIPQNVNGWVSNFAELHGIKGIKPQRQVELQGYAVASVNTFEKEEGNPFADGSDFKNNIGLDGKIGITSDLTLDFTVNPDFGQVEADPSALNLDGFQIFFSEKRPFFIENANLFSFNVSQVDAGGPHQNDNLFYSRRIGVSPRGDLDLPDGANADIPEFTSILGAAKFSGKTKDGWSIGVLESISAEEKAVIDIDGERSSRTVEPLTNYFVGRLSKDINQGESSIGGTLTSVNRRLENTGLEDQFHKNAYSGGIDLFHSWDNREWQLRGNFIFSNVEGTAAKIEDTQTAFEHYFQRPDADHISVDPTKTSLFGHGGTFSIANYGGNDNISFQTGVTWRSPEIELNDVGFLNTADEINHFLWAGYRFPNPFSIFRSLRINYNQYSRWTFGGMHTYQAFNTNTHAAFKNYWRMGMGVTFETKDISTKALFGGPSLRQTRGFAPWIYIETDSRKKVRFNINTSMFNAIGKDKGAVKVRNVNLSIFAQPSNAFSVSIGPRYFRQERAIQNVSHDTFEGQDRYVTGSVKQETFSLSIRANYSITPNLTLEYWGQPFISRGNYSEFKYITDPLAVDYRDRFQLFESNQVSYDAVNEVFSIDEDRNGVTDYTFDDPDFNFMQFRSNMVLRWEYRPGSELFLVWSQSTTNLGDPQDGLFNSLTENLFDESINNILLVKGTFRFLR